MTGKTFPQNPAAGDDDGAVDGTPAADADGSPCAVEIASAASAAARSRTAARILGVTRSTLRTKMRQLGITLGRVVHDEDAPPADDAKGP